YLRSAHRWPDRRSRSSPAHPVSPDSRFAVHRPSRLLQTPLLRLTPVPAVGRIGNVRHFPANYSAPELIPGATAPVPASVKDSHVFACTPPVPSEAATVD